MKKLGGGCQISVRKIKALRKGPSFFFCIGKIYGWGILIRYKHGSKQYLQVQTGNNRHPPTYETLVLEAVRCFSLEQMPASTNNLQQAQAELKGLLDASTLPSPRKNIVTPASATQTRGSDLVRRLHVSNDSHKDFNNMTEGEQKSVLHKLLNNNYRSPEEEEVNALSLLSMLKDSLS